MYLSLFALFSYFLLYVGLFIIHLFLCISFVKLCYSNRSVYFYNFYRSIFCLLVFLFSILFKLLCCKLRYFFLFWYIFQFISIFIYFFNYFFISLFFYFGDYYQVII